MMILLKYQALIPIGKMSWNNLYKIMKFPCVGDWDRIHVYTSSKLKLNYSSKKR